MTGVLPGVLQNKKNYTKNTTNHWSFWQKMAPPNCRRHIPGQNQRVSECPGSRRPGEGIRETIWLLLELGNEYPPC